ncbi:MAG: PIN domain-containing protein [Terracidiphilus sp.]
MTGPITKVLVDTSIWSRHFRSPNSYLVALLKSDRVVMHPFVIAELSLYSWPDRMAVLATLEDMPPAAVADLKEVRELIEIRALYDQGIGLVDAHLLSSIILSPIPTELWTADSNLAEAADTLGVLSPLPLPRVQ